MIELAHGTPYQSRNKVFLLLFLQKKKILFFSEEKNQKTFIPCASSKVRNLGG
jgi:hypothetical protein